MDTEKRIKISPLQGESFLDIVIETDIHEYRVIRTDVGTDYPGSSKVRTHLVLEPTRKQEILQRQREALVKAAESAKSDWETAREEYHAQRRILEQKAAERNRANSKLQNFDKENPSIKGLSTFVGTNYANQASVRVADVFNVENVRYQY